MTNCDEEHSVIKAYIDDLLNSFGGAIPTIKPDVLQKLYAEKDYAAMLGWIKNSMRLELRVGLRIVDETDDHHTMWIEISKPIPVIGTSEFKNTRVTVNVTRDTIDIKPFDWIVAGFAHELSHVVLFSIGHKLQEDEKAVDLTAMILGFENFEVTAHHAKSDKIWVAGYLTLSERKFAAAYLKKIRRTRQSGNTTFDTEFDKPSSEERHSSGNYIAKHWRGELPLPIAYWVNGFVGNIFVAVAVIAISKALNFKDNFYPAVALCTAVLIWTTILITATWQVVGSWRSATSYQHAKRFWGGAAKVFTIIGVARLALSFTQNGVPQLQELLQIYQGDARLGTHAFTVLRDGRELKFSGGITLGVAKGFEELLNAMPLVRIVLLDSPGGRIFEAAQIGEAIKSRGLDTRVTRQCMSACTTIFLSGRERSIASTARLGFHLSNFGTPVNQFARPESEATRSTASLPDLSRFGTPVDRPTSGFVARTNEQPSFDCKKASESIEQIICADADLALWDHRLGIAFKNRAAQLDLKSRRALVKSQRDWIALRNHKCDIPSTWSTNDIASIKPCLVLTITARIDAIVAGIVP